MGCYFIYFQLGIDCFFFVCLNQAKERTAIKAALYNVSETWINVEVSRRERGSGVVLRVWLGGEKGS